MSSSSRAWLLLLVPALAATAAAARGVQTFTPPIRSTEGNRIACLVQNLGEASVAAHALLRSTTAPMENEMAVAPGATAALIETTAEKLNAYCRFEIQADPATVRGFIALNDATSGAPLLLAAAAAVNDTASAPNALGACPSAPP
jgi:hypothetical protein